MAAHYTVSLYSLELCPPSVSLMGTFSVAMKMKLTRQRAQCSWAQWNCDVDSSRTKIFEVTKVTNISSSFRKGNLSPHHCEMWSELYFPGNDMMTGGYVIENEKVLYRLAFKFIIRQWDWWLRVRKKWNNQRSRLSQCSQHTWIPICTAHIHANYIARFESIYICCFYLVTQQIMY